jgi:ubiquitin C-terminal hydrolase
MLNPAEGLISSNIADAVQTWHLQAGVIVQALVHAPNDLIIQLPRFREAENGIVKHRIPLSLRPGLINLPVFTAQENTECAWIPYTIRAALLHLGETITSGHYRSVLIEARSQTCWLTDDGTSAQPSDLQNALIEENCYVLFCTRTQETDE